MSVEFEDHPRSKYLQRKLLKSSLIRTPVNINCSKVVEGDSVAVTLAHMYNLNIKSKRVQLTERDYMNFTEDCENYKVKRNFLSFVMSKEEEDYPIAYSIVIQDNIEMFERLLRSIYTPQNIYCVHVDDKAPNIFKQAVKAITSCFGNVFMATKLEDMIHALWSRVQADLNCMKDLLDSNIKWVYLLNACGSDFPIKTNAEIVNTLKVLNGKNSVESIRPPEDKMSRWFFHYEIGTSVVRTNYKKTIPPISIPIFYGSGYFVVTRQFVKHIFASTQIHHFLHWAKDTYSPNEHIWATLNRLPGVPGSLPHNSKYDITDAISIARLVKWEFYEGDVNKGAQYPSCKGTHQQNVCIFGSGDLHWLLQQQHLLAGKFDPMVDNIAIQCLEETLRYKTLYGNVMSVYGYSGA
ncbi:beta-1,3-galactosyl-O-glycosyl-glycoprotein beta-1,6-N-acetylglucosaminyltransferase 3-like [Spea bombifrons]|uniref:beta-1,3-galactosyl-O-glycosyl-glycoprotein beta-1,6-N-acetylglucosaminyltransferase 3-like n=1 Tax=Spea bombifrons TaxID=233779 RepID=UPI00234A767C|nr:beta-1,3-galactosyl-O-glycosyl-glycoprotein beta-1,6-N-acetylglucosaminyltransferase 3-like [Spea bombifrons]